MVMAPTAAPLYVCGASAPFTKPMMPFIIAVSQRPLVKPEASDEAAPDAVEL